MKQSFTAGNWAIWCLAPSRRDQRWTEGEGIIAMQYLRSLVPEWLWSAQDFPSPPSPPPVFRGLFFHQLNFTLGFLRSNLTAFLPFPTPTKSQVATGLGILKVSTFRTRNATVRRWGLCEHKSELGAGWHGLSLPWQPKPSQPHRLFIHRSGRVQWAPSPPPDTNVLATKQKGLLIPLWLGYTPHNLLSNAIEWVPLAKINTCLLQPVRD